MKKLNFEQSQFVKNQYEVLSGECKRLFTLCDTQPKLDNYEELRIARAKLSGFISAIEGLFNIDFYKYFLDAV